MVEKYWIGEGVLRDKEIKITDEKLRKFIDEDIQVVKLSELKKEIVKSAGKLGKNIWIIMKKCRIRLMKR